MKTKIVIGIWIGIMILTGWITGWAAEDTNNKPPLMVGEIAQFLVDPSGEVVFEEMIADADSDFFEFQNHGSRVFQFGLTKDVHWIRFKVNDFEENILASCNQYLLYFDYSGIESVELYIPIQDKEKTRYVQFLGGFRHSGVQDETGYIFPVFRLPQNIDSEKYVYGKVESIYSKNFSIGLVEEKDFAGTQHRILMSLSFVYGAMLAMMLYNMVLYFAMKDKTYLYYVGYILFMTIYQMSVTGIIKIIDFDLGEVLELYTLATTFIAIIFALLFAWSFINLPIFVPQAKYPVYGCFATCSVGIILVLSGNQFYANGLAYLMGTVLPFLLFTTAVTAYYKGQIISKYYISATAVLFTTVIAYVLRGLGYLEHNLMTAHAVTASVGIESILLSFALADRIRLLRKHREQADQRATELTHISMTDSLTGVFNRRYFDTALSKLQENTDRMKNRVALIYIDIDFFKKFNDTYGHPKGDCVLKDLAKVIRKSIREEDAACRIGGEEFAVIFYHIDENKTAQIAERIRETFEKTDFSDIAPKIPTVTVSIGVAGLRSDETIEAWVGRTDEALYQAKATGRNRVVVSEK
ncbi:sensor domain-containing diguanylate cyclase [Tindallia californiensis]|uniref:Diguanylate cyclase (GGDEF) domain-containing protein n=1 Tax=Tindallia californiensis TaxID=159292 RepID=A0A1H3KBT2_9FIRM|nr:diguanylate cyclase [Tindallia californiensis]SDY49369.1 diguanylate cyclase (GGDEF) domain-containing protein [Tindallia californiensis]